jgi:hypothetical protein
MNQDENYCVHLLEEGTDKLIEDIEITKEQLQFLLEKGLNQVFLETIEKNKFDKKICEK